MGMSAHPSVSGTAHLMQQALHTLADLSGLQYDWDSYGAYPPSTQALSATYSFLLQLSDRYGGRLRESIVPWSVAALASGGLQLSWRGPQGEIEVDVDPLGDCGYLLIREQGPDRHFEEGEHISIEDVSTMIAIVLGDQADG